MRLKGPQAARQKELGFCGTPPTGPLAHDLEIRGALAERRAGPPAVGLQKIGRRGENVGNAVPEIDVSVAVIVDAIFHVRGWQKLRLADLACVRTDQVAQKKNAALDDL